METLRVAICEDDKIEGQILLQLLENSPYPTDVSLFTSGEDFLNKFQAFQYDLIFMDIFMERLSGIRVVTEIRLLDSQVPVAFITSSRDFALESYRLNAMKYIEKPATKTAVEEALQMAHLKQQAVDRLVVRTKAKAVAYPISQILFVEQQGRNLVLHLLGGEQVTVPKKLGDIEDQLAGKHFLRCHKSYLVNLAFVRDIDRELSTFTMVQGSHVHIRRESFWKVKKAFEDYLFATQQEDFL